MKLGAAEIILIIALVLIMFGGGKLASIGGALGKSVHDFKRAVKEDDHAGKNKGA